MNAEYFANEWCQICEIDSMCTSSNISYNFVPTKFEVPCLHWNILKLVLYSIWNMWTFHPLSMSNMWNWLCVHVKQCLISLVHANIRSKHTLAKVHIIHTQYNTPYHTTIMKHALKHKNTMQWIAKMHFLSNVGLAAVWIPLEIEIKTELVKIKWNLGISKLKS